MKVAEIVSGDIEELKELQPDGWPDITEHFNFYIRSSFCNPIKILLNNRIAGIGCAILHGNTAWLGHIIVHKEYRNKGIGTAVTKTLCDQFNKNQFRTISLIATQLGEPVYKKLGFRTDTEYHFFRNEDIKGFDYDTDSIKSDGSAYADEILDIDSLASGENRTLLLRPHIAHAKVFIKNNRVTGFYLPTLNEGPVVSTDPSAGIELLKLRFINKSVSVLPQENETAIQFLTKNNFRLYQKGTRMSLGQKTEFRPDMIFSRIGGNMG